MNIIEIWVFVFAAMMASHAVWERLNTNFFTFPNHATECLKFNKSVDQVN